MAVIIAKKIRNIVIDQGANASIDVKITRTSDSTSFIIQDGILTILASTV